MSESGKLALFFALAATESQLFIRREEPQFVDDHKVSIA
jgi:hypothetical protein